jgi:hypothetical protein
MMERAFLDLDVHAWSVWAGRRVGVGHLPLVVFVRPSRSGASRSSAGSLGRRYVKLVSVLSSARRAR